MQIENHKIGEGQSAFVVAEVAQAHDGSLGMAHAFINAAAEAGADAIKFQTHIAAAESTLDEKFRVRFSLQDETRFAYWKRMEFTSEQWAGLADHAGERDLVFLSSAFSPEAVSLLAALNVPAWKIASGEVGSNMLIAEMAGTGAPFIVSTGMSGWSEITTTAERLRSLGNEFALLQCTSKYPTPLEEVGLNVIDELRTRFMCPAGLSDHSGCVHPALGALARGADILELHITLDRRMFGPDTVASLTVNEFRQVVEFRDALARIDSNPVDKDAMASDLVGMRNLFMRSLAPARDLRAGTVLSEDMIATKKPGTGIAAVRMKEYIGRRLVRDASAQRLFSEEDFE